jgi:hypothetical protein
MDASVKLVRSNGAELWIYAEPVPLMRFAARLGGPPLKHNGWRVVTDEEAREVAREVITAGCYERTM